jgi:hypothetical protein
MSITVILNEKFKAGPGLTVKLGSNTINRLCLIQAEESSWRILT